MMWGLLATLLFGAVRNYLNLATCVIFWQEYTVLTHHVESAFVLSDELSSGRD